MAGPGKQAQILEQVWDAVVTTDADYTIVGWNRAAATLYGWSAEEALGRPAAQVLLTEFQQDAPRDVVLDAVAERGHWRGVVTQAHRDGSRFWVRSSVTRVTDPQAGFVGYVAVNRNISDERVHLEHAERARRRAEQVAELAAALAEVPHEINRLADRLVASAAEATDDVCLVVYNERVSTPRFALHAPEAVSEALTAVLTAHPIGTTEAGFFGRVMHDDVPLVMDALDPDQFAELFLPQYRDVARQLGITQLIAIPLRAAGQALGALVSMHAGAAPSDPSRVRYLQTLAHHGALAIHNAHLYAAQVETNAVLATRSRELEVAVGDLETFAYSVSHDLRAPVRAIAGLSAMLEEDLGPQLGPEDAHCLSRIGANAERMSRLIDALLVLSRVTRQPFERQPVDLARIARSVAEELDAQEAHTVQFDCPATLKLSGDPDLIRVLLFNLMGNAWKFTRRTEAAHVTLRARGASGFMLCDNGVGFDSGGATRLFQPFERLHDTGTFPGEGIGLATALRVVRRHKGHIEAAGEPGRGAEFRVDLEAPKGQ
jgi:PAS domain S-box-containing protein